MSKILTARSLRRAWPILLLLLLAGLGLALIAPYLLKEYHLRQARQALTRQRYRQALDELHAALRFQPNNPRLHLLAGRVARQGGQFPTAWEHLRRCRELQKSVSADLQLEEYLLRAQTGEVDEVYRYLAPHIFHDDEQTPLVLEALSHIYLYTYRFDRAWQCLQHWLHLQPDNAEALFLRATFFSLKMNAEAALDDLQRVLELDPERIPARLLLAQTLKDRNHPEEAANEYRTVLQQEPNNFTARVGMATYHAGMQEWDQASALIDGLEQERPDDVEVMTLRAQVEAGQGRLKEAIQVLRKVLKINPGVRSACYQLSLYLHRQGKDKEALHYEARLEQIEKDQHRLLEITGENSDQVNSSPALCYELGAICMRLGIVQRGLHWLRIALERDPRYRPAHEELLRYYEKLGPEGEAQAALHRRWLEQAKQ